MRFGLTHSTSGRIRAVTHGTTILGQVFKMIPRSHIESLDNVYGTGRPSRVLSRWSQFGALVFAQLAGRQSIRDVVNSMAAQSTALAPLCLAPPKRSTLAEANERRPATLYSALLATRYSRCRALAPRHGFRFKNPLFSGDSIVAMDRGYIDDQCLFRLTQDGVYFVTRQKVNAKVKVRARFAVDWQRGITSDHNVVLLGQKGTAYPTVLRRVGDGDLETGKHYVFWTNAFHLAAATIAAIYKERWQIELFFKAIKQHLKIKTFLGTSENAVMTQIWVALITYLMLAFLRFQAGLGISFQQMLRLLQINLFDRRNLVDLCYPQQRNAPGGQQLCVA